MITEKPKPVLRLLGPPNPIYDPSGFPAYFEQSDDEDIEELARIGQMKVDARKAAGSWPDESDHSEMGMKRLGRAHRQVDEFAENVFYKPVADWLPAHPQYPVHHVESEDRGWDRLKERPAQWYDGVAHCRGGLRFARRRR